MAEIPYMPVFCEPLLADTDHLSDAEMGLYTRMLIKLWLAPRQRFPNDVAWLARKFRKTEEEALATVMPLIREFFQTDGNWISHKRLSREFARVSAQLQKQSDRAKSRWQKGKRVSRGNAGPAMPSTSTSTDSTSDVESPSDSTEQTLIGPEESPAAAQETPTPRASPEDGAAAPGRGQELVPLGRVSAQAIDGLMPYYETMNSRAGVERLVELLVEQVGSAAMVEGRLIDATARRKRDPIQYVRRVLENHGVSRFAAVESAKHRNEHGRPDPNMEADRQMREILKRMGTSNDDDTASYPRLPH